MRILVVSIAMLLVGIVVGYSIASLGVARVGVSTTTITIEKIRSVTTTSIVTTSYVHTHIVTQTLRQTVAYTIERILTSIARTTVTKIVETTVTRTVPTPITIVSRSLEIEFLPTRSYYYELMHLIEHANESIYVLMFVAKYDPGDRFDWANDVLQALCRAKARGLDIKVVLDQTTLKEYRQTIELLKDCGIDVRIWIARSKMHAKLVIVDRRYLFVGSHNWTESALYYNIEASILVEDPKLAQQALGLFQEVWKASTPV